MRLSETCVGEAKGRACALIGLLSDTTPSLQARLPKVQAPSVALVRVSLASKLALAPGASVRLAGVTTTSQPARLGVAT